MKSISDIKLYGNVDLSKLKESCSDIAITEKHEILDYLKNNSFASSCATEKVVDCFENKKTDIQMVAYHDDEYYWDDRDIYHFEKYNLKLNEDFIQHVLNRS